MLYRRIIPSDFAASLFYRAVIFRFAVVVFPVNRVFRVLHRVVYGVRTTAKSVRRVLHVNNAKPVVIRIMHDRREVRREGLIKPVGEFIGAFLLSVLYPDGLVILAHVYIPVLKTHKRERGEDEFLVLLLGFFFGFDVPVKSFQFPEFFL
jgi:hypothetical protein